MDRGSHHKLKENGYITATMENGKKEYDNEETIAVC